MKRAISLSFSIIEADYRVIRQCSSFNECGYNVLVFGLPSDIRRKTDFPFQIRCVGNKRDSSYASLDRKEINVENISLRERLVRVNSLIRNSLLNKKKSTFFQVFNLAVKVIKIPFTTYDLLKLALCASGVIDWRKVYWASSLYRVTWREVDEELAKETYEVIIANDWQTLPIAFYASKKYNLKLMYDSHEHGVSENAHLILRNFLSSRYIFRLEKECLSKASLVMSVSNGIVEALKKQYSLRCECHAVLNVPKYEATVGRKVDHEKIILYYHGFLKENRHLETLLKALAYLDERYFLIYRGAHRSSVSYEKYLFLKAREFGVASRFRIEPMASNTDMIQLASLADIGFSLPPLNSLHSDMALPNKFFEYVMAGLAVAVSDVTEMGMYVNHHQVGLVIKDLNPKQMAKQIMSISVNEIDTFKKNSLQLASKLCWEEESKVMSRLIKSLSSEDERCAV